MKSNVFFLLILIGLMLWVYKPFLNFGVPYTHDGQIHIARMANYFLGYKQGQWPVRWAPNLNEGFGYPVFNFNYPLPYLMSIPLISVNLSLETTYKTLMLLGLFGLVSAMFLFLKQQFGNLVSLVGAFSLGVSPYVANLLYVRGGLGELLSLFLGTWVLVILVGLKKKMGVPQCILLSVFLSMWLLTHNVFVLIGGPILIAISVWVGWVHKKARVGLGISWLIAFLNASFFWVPALLEKNLVILDAVSLSTAFAIHALTVEQFFISEWGYGFSFPGPVDSMEMGIGWFYSLMLLMLVGMGIYNRRFARKTLFALGLVGLVFIFSSDLGMPMAKLIPGFNYVQFPWRLVVIATVVLAYLTAKMLHELKHPWIISSLALLLLINYAAKTYKPVSTFSFNDHYYFETGQTTSTLDENMPKGFDKFKAYPLNNTYFLERPVFSQNPDSSITIEIWNGSIRRYSVDSQSPSTMVEQGARFAGWQTTINGSVVDYIEAGSDFAGLIAYEVPAGFHEVESRFTQRTLPRRIGNTLSGIGLLLLAGLCGYGMWQKKMWHK